MYSPLKYSLVVLSVLGLGSANFNLFPPPPPPPPSTLVLLHVLFRHGNRAVDPGSTFPTDQYKNETYPPYGLSQLTVKGKQTEFKIGRYLRSTYDNFIPKQYTPQVASALTTNFKRTKNSLELVLAGLFPPTPQDLFQESPNWQPISFNIEQAQGVIGTGGCPTYVNAYYGYIFKQEAQGILKRYKSLFQTLSKHTGVKVKVPLDVLLIYVTLKSQEDFGLKLPDWTKDLYPKTIEEAAGLFYEFSTATVQLKRQTAGSLLKKILQDTYSKINGTLPQERRVFLYSAHEFNVGTLLRALDVFYRHVPPFGATVFLEVHLIDEEYVVKVLYQDYQQTDPKVLTIPGCTTLCPLDQFADIVRDVLPGPADVCKPSGEIS